MQENTNFNYEKTLVLIKPGFVFPKLVSDVSSSLKCLTECSIISQGKVKYDKESAKIHYSNKKDEPFYDKLVDYMSSDVSYGFVIEGRDVIRRVEKLKHYLRVMLQERYNLDTDVMRNIIHSASKTKIDDDMSVGIDADKEVRLFRKMLRTYKAQKELAKKNLLNQTSNLKIEVIGKTL